MSYINQIIQFFRDDDAISRRMRQRFRWARSVEDLKKVDHAAAWLRMHWHGLFQPGVQDDLGKLTAHYPRPNPSAS